MKNVYKFSNYCGIRLISLLLSIFIIIIYLSACNDIDTNSRTESRNDPLATISDESIMQESNDYSDFSDSVSEIDTSEESVVETPEQKMAAGEIRNDASDANNIEEAIKPLAEWYCKNLNSNNHTMKEYIFKGHYEYKDIKTFKLYYAAYERKVLYGSETITFCFSVIFGVLADKPNEYILIDGAYTYTSLEQSWDKVKNHKIFGNLIDHYPIEEKADNLDKFNISSLIGKNRYIHLEFSYSDTEMIIISTDNNKDLKMDLIDITKVTLVKSFKLDEIEEQGYTIRYINYPHYFDSKCLIFKVFTNNNNKYGWYKINFNSDATIDKCFILNSETEEKNVFPDETRLVSESGRYSTFYITNDLYIHDSVLNTDTLVYDSKPEEYADDINVYKYAFAEFFIGNILYYSLTGWEASWGVNSYNPDTKETIEYKNRMYASFYVNEYIYGETSFFDDYYYGRFNINETDGTERLIGSVELESSYITHSADGRYIAQISDYKFYSDIFLMTKTKTVTIYDSITFKKIKSYTLDTDYQLVGNGIYYPFFVGDYVYIPFKDGDNMAFIIKVN